MRARRISLALLAALALAAWTHGSSPGRLFASGSTDFLLNDLSVRLLAQ